MNLLVFHSYINQILYGRLGTLTIQVGAIVGNANNAVNLNYVIIGLVIVVVVLIVITLVGNKK